MEASVESSPAQEAVFELKAGHFNLPNLRLLSPNMEALDEQLLARVQQAPGFFHNTPVVIDLSLMAQQNAEINFALLVGLMRGYGMVPVAVQGGTPQQQEMAEFLELAILASNQLNPGMKPASAKPTRGNAGLTTPYARLVTKPIRSGQRIYAAGRDLVITAPVSNGAEVIADGNIHIYGALRGRALAGVKGHRNARIYCRNLQAELVAIAGQYRVNEQMEASQLGNPAQIYLSEKKLIIEKL